MQNYYTTHTRPELLLPVPLHRIRLRSRGYNQASEIAKHISAVCNIRLHRRLLARTRDTRPQTEIGTAKKRLVNLQGAFLVKAPAALENVKSVAIIDDVVTTMATVTAATIALQNAGIAQVEVWCIARASR